MYRVQLSSQETLRQKIEILRDEGELSTDPTEALTLWSDELPSEGGSGTAPAPYEYLLTSLAACTSMTLRVYADRKGIPLKELQIEITHEKREVPDSHVKADFFSKTITVQGELSDEQLERLKEIAEKCPINRIIKSSVLMESTIRRG